MLTILGAFIMAAVTIGTAVQIAQETQASGINNTGTAVIGGKPRIHVDCPMILYC